MNNSFIELSNSECMDVTGGFNPYLFWGGCALIAACIVIAIVCPPAGAGEAYGLICTGGAGVICAMSGMR